MSNSTGLSRSAKRWLDEEYQKKHAEWNRAWEATKGQSEERKARRAAQMREYRKTDAYKKMQHAHGVIRRAINSGTIVKMPCEKCGNCKVEAHHDDYNNPHEINWLCKVHHVERHKLIAKKED